MGFADERGQYAEGHEEHKPGRGHDESDGEGEGGDDLLKETAHELNHGEAVCGLNAGAFETVVEDGVFVGGEIELGGLLHDADADVLGVAVGEQRVGVVDGAGHETHQDVEANLGGDQGPEVGGQGRAVDDAGDIADDVLGDLGDTEGQGRDNDAQAKAP